MINMKSKNSPKSSSLFLSLSTSDSISSMFCFSGVYPMLFKAARNSVSDMRPLPSVSNFWKASLEQSSSPPPPPPESAVARCCKAPASPPGSSLDLRTAARSDQRLLSFSMAASLVFRAKIKNSPKLRLSALPLLVDTPREDFCKPWPDFSLVCILSTMSATCTPKICTRASAKCSAESRASAAGPSLVVAYRRKIFLISSTSSVEKPS
mmetsp:Transcript_128556/g.320619  ORF Transcript_128556/g.320619 Transcript_128556/m.320619 type:complete len:209 (-) Transcript_128556:501-1127(-)